MAGRKTPLPWGGWPSVITADMITAGSVARDHPCKVGNRIYWQESRPREQGRITLVERAPGGETRELIPSTISVQSRVHEYGGKCWLLDGCDLFYANKADQRVYHLDISTPGECHPRPLTAAGRGLRFADFCLDRRRDRLIAVCEQHHGDGGEPDNFLAIIPLDGSDSENRDPYPLVAGDDFYAWPRLSPDGQHLCWVSWNHPSMPWDGTCLYRAAIDGCGRPQGIELVAGGDGESIFQPTWSPGGELYFVSDRNGWWNLYRTRHQGEQAPLHNLAADFATPLWSLGMTTYGFVDDGTIATLFTRNGGWELGLLDTDSGTLDVLETPCTAMHNLTCSGDGDVLFAGSTPVSANDIFQLPRGTARVLRLTDSTPAIDPAHISSAAAITFATGDGDTAHGFFYPPANADYTGPADTLPPLVVMCHGGPTGASNAVLNYKIQYWTSRGFALLDVNYRGSTGYGRAYREKLKLRWGLADVADAVAGVDHLAAQGLVDASRVIIRGSSAGGYTVLAALAFTDRFRSGASLYGIGDLEALLRDTHKFESRYLDSLVGPWPEAADEYRRRSPIHHLDGLSCPVIFLQGLEDNIVPPNQADMMVAALDRKGIPVAHVTFADEGHGFRKADNIKRALEAELFFHRAVLGIPSPEKLPAIPIHNMG